MFDVKVSYTILVFAVFNVRASTNIVRRGVGMNTIQINRIFDRKVTEERTFDGGFEF